TCLELTDCTAGVGRPERCTSVHRVTAGSHVPGRRRRQWLRLAGASVAALAIALCVRTLVVSWPRAHAALASAGPGWLVLALALSAAAMLGLALVWWRCLRLFGAPVPVTSATAWYFGGELGKYVPGGIWTVLGR